MKNLKPYLIFIIVLIFKLNIYADVFPGDLPGTEIGGSLPTGYEPSGTVWHTGLSRLFIVDDGGKVYSMDADGSNVSSIFQSYYDLEAICVADYNSEFIYLGVENPDGIFEFDLNTGQTKRFFDLTPWMTGPGNLGLESLTFVKDTTNAEGGFFYAGLQNDGKIYVFQLPVKTSSTSITVNFIKTITPVAGRWDLSGLHYDEESRVLYGIWDAYNKLRAMNIDGTYIAEWDLPGNDQEGIALWEGNGYMQRKIFIAEDVGKEVWKYDFNSSLSITVEGNGTIGTQPETPGYYGSSMILSAIADTGWFFSEWNGDLVGNNITDTIFMNSDKEVFASFSPDTTIYFDLKVLLEGPYNGSDMNTGLNSSGNIPLSQPYNVAPWNYAGTESVDTIPADVVDWVLIELCDTTDADLATAKTVITRQAAFLLDDGKIVDVNSNGIIAGVSVNSNGSCSIAGISVTNNLFVVIFHRNHLPIMSANPVAESDEIFTYDFTTPAGQAFGTDAQKNIGGVYAMFAGDGDANGTIESADKNNIWNLQAGMKGYFSGDFNMDGQVMNHDKNDVWFENLNEQTQIPQ